LRLLFPFAKRFIAGIDINDSSPVFQKHLESKYTVIANLVGENTQSKEKIDSTCKSYSDLLNQFNHQNFSISLKLSSIGLDVSYEECRSNLFMLASIAKENKQIVRLDMEDSNYTSKTIELSNYINKALPGSIGITLQANLFRTKDDLNDLLGNGISIRLVKGAYKENSGNAFLEIDKIRERFIEYSGRLIQDSVIKHSIATHDEILLNEISTKDAMKKHRFEFLFGVRRDLQRRFKDKQEVGIYMPYGKEWLSYTMRRLKEFKNIKFVAENLIKEK
jgi:proline dehydrogenase